MGIGMGMGMGKENGMGWDGIIIKKNIKNIKSKNIFVKNSKRNFSATKIKIVFLKWEWEWEWNHY